MSSYSGCFSLSLSLSLSRVVGMASRLAPFSFTFLHTSTTTTTTTSRTSLPPSRCFHHCSPCFGRPRFAAFLNNNPNFSVSSLFSHPFVSDSRSLLAAASALPSSSADVADNSSEEPPSDSALDMSEQQALREAFRRMEEEDLEEAAEKYNLDEELFSEVHYAQINAFTDRPFGGNPAAVVYLPYERDDKWLQLVAREFNLSETSFLIKRRASKKRSPESTVNQSDYSPSLLGPDESGKRPKDLSKDAIPVDNEFELRWFTPRVEVDLCGHATLAAAHLMFSTGIVEGEIICFHTKSGVLKARKVAGYDEELTEADQKERLQKKKYSSAKGVVELDFPLVIASKCDASEAARISSSLGDAKIVWCGKTALGDYLVEVPSSKDVEQVQPRFADMVGFSGRGGVIVTAQAPAESTFDFISRFFCPKAGIPEDPVTGSAHCTLGPYWAKKLGKSKLEAYQASERGGKLTVCVDVAEGRAYLEGSAMLAMAGVLINTLET